MSDTKKYYYMRLKEDFFEDDNIILLESMDDGYLYVNILFKLYLRSLKYDGKLIMKGYIPYNASMIAKITRHQVGTVERCLKILQQMGMIEVLDDGTIYMSDIQSFIGSSTTEADRKRDYRNRINAHKEAIRQMSDEIPDKCPDKCPDERPDERPPENKRLIDKRLIDYNNPPIIPPQGDGVEDNKEVKKSSKNNSKKTPTVKELLKERNFSEKLEKAVSDWAMYKIEKNQGYKCRGFLSLLSQIENKVSEYGESAVIDVINLSMSQNWQGITWRCIETGNSRKSLGYNSGKSGGGEYIITDEEREESL